MEETEQNIQNTEDNIFRVFQIVAEKENRTVPDPSEPIIGELMTELVGIWKEFEENQELTDDQKIALNEIYVKAYKK